MGYPYCGIRYESEECDAIVLKEFSTDNPGATDIKPMLDDQMWDSSNSGYLFQIGHRVPSAGVPFRAVCLDRIDDETKIKLKKSMLAHHPEAKPDEIFLYDEDGRYENYTWVLNFHEPLFNMLSDTDGLLSDVKIYGKYILWFRKVDGAKIHNADDPFKAIESQIGSLDGYSLFLGWGILNPVGPTLNLLLIERKHQTQHRYLMPLLQIHPMATGVAKLFDIDDLSKSYEEFLETGIEHLAEECSFPQVLIPSVAMTTRQALTRYAEMIAAHGDGKSAYAKWKTRKNYASYLDSITSFDDLGKDDDGPIGIDAAYDYACDRFDWFGDDLRTWMQMLKSSMMFCSGFGVGTDEDYRLAVAKLLNHATIVEKPLLFRSPIKEPIVIDSEPKGVREYADLLRKQFGSNRSFSIEPLAWMAA